jgi:hypothetical protein
MQLALYETHGCELKTSNLNAAFILRETKGLSAINYHDVTVVTALVPFDRLMVWPYYVNDVFRGLVVYSLAHSPKYRPVAACM